MNWKTEKVSDVCTNIRIKYEFKKDWEQWGLLCADAHLDNPKTDLELKKHHLEQAKERNAFVMEIGDTFDAMQGKTDRRSDKADLRPEFRGAYLNDLVDFASDFYMPYKDNMALISEGNHESSVKNKLEYNLLDGLVRDLSREGSPVIRGGYRGWIRFMFQAKTGGRKSFRFYYLHGSGGGGPVTKGVIQTNRRAVYIDGADAVLSGHIHENWIFPITQIGLNDNGREYKKEQYHISLPTYKEEFLNHSEGWHHERGGPPKPTGAVWVRFYYSNRTKSVEMEFLNTDK